MERDCWLGFDLGGTKMLTQVYDRTFAVLGKERRKTKASDNATTGLDRIVDTIRQVLTGSGVASERLAGIGIGCPGPVDMDRGILLNPPNLGWSDANVRKRLESEFDCPVVVINDVDAGVYAEYRFGAGQGARTVLGVFPGTGIGGGCVHQGEVFRGRGSSCMEIGHIQVQPDGPPCGCGQRGCLEAVAGRTAIAAQAARAAFRGEAPRLLEKVGTDIANIKSGALADSIKGGDKVIEQIVQDAAASIGTAVGGLVNVLCPDVIVMGGGLVAAMPDIFVDGVRKVARKRVMTSYRNAFEVLPAKLGDEAGVLGAAAWARHVTRGDE